ncbi:MAG: hypothetical protein LBV74_16130 [Tannerella sp.]|jgi:hypothetical protein|nr:hypothetical protein [Tannerella sp.]
MRNGLLTLFLLGIFTQCGHSQNKVESTANIDWRSQSEEYAKANAPKREIVSQWLHQLEVEDVVLKEAIPTCWNGDSIIVAHYYLLLDNNEQSGMVSYVHYPKEKRQVRVAIRISEHEISETPVVYFADVDDDKKDDLIYIYDVISISKMNGHVFRTIRKDVYCTETFTPPEIDETIFKFTIGFYDDPWGGELNRLSGSVGGQAKPFDKQQIMKIMEKSFPVK